MTLSVVLIIAIIAGLYMAWNIGANDVANAMGTSVGSGALTLKQAVLLAAVFEFTGAFFIGGHVAQTIQTGIVDVKSLSAAEARPDRADPPAAPAIGPAMAAAIATAPARSGDQSWWGASEATNPSGHLYTQLILGMLAALIASSIWLNVATYFGQPVSTTHAIIGAVIGFAIVAAGVHAVVWSMMGTIALSWVISPLVGAALAFIVYRLVQKYVLSSRHPVFMARRALPIGVAAVTFIIALSVIYHVLHLKPDMVLLSVPLALLLAGISAIMAWKMLGGRNTRRHVHRSQRYQLVERWFGRLQVMTACYMAFAHGANDVANAIGPLGGIFHYAGGGTIADKAPVPFWLLAMGGVGIILGLSTYGYKVMAAVGKKITEITPTRGFAAEFGTASTVLVCSLMGLPISTTFVLVGAVMGVGMARGFGAIDLGVVRKIFASWLITIPVSAGLSAGIFALLMRCL